MDIFAPFQTGMFPDEFWGDGVWEGWIEQPLVGRSPGPLNSWWWERSLSSGAARPKELA